jgi:hypothetical protein
MIEIVVLATKIDASGGGNALRGGKSARYCHSAATQLRSDLDITTARQQN